MWSSAPPPLFLVRHLAGQVILRPLSANTHDHTYEDSRGHYDAKQVLQDDRTSVGTRDNVRDQAVDDDKRDYSDSCVTSPSLVDWTIPSGVLLHLPSVLWHPIFSSLAPSCFLDSVAISSTLSASNINTLASNAQMCSCRSFRARWELCSLSGSTFKLHSLLSDLLPLM